MLPEGKGRSWPSQLQPAHLLSSSSGSNGIDLHQHVCCAPVISAAAVELQVCACRFRGVFCVPLALFCFCSTNLGGRREVISNSASDVMNNSFSVLVISIGGSVHIL